MTACDPRVSGNSFHDDHCYLAKKGYNADIAGKIVREFAGKEYVKGITYKQAELKEDLH